MLVASLAAEDDVRDEFPAVRKLKIIPIHR